MVAFSYGEWDYICRNSPQPICNLFFRQLLIKPERGSQFAPDQSLNLPNSTDELKEALSYLGIGINPICTIPRMESVGGQSGSVGNIANIIFCCLAFLISIWLFFKASRRRAAVGRVEVMLLFIVYGLISIFQLLDTGSILEQGSRSIVWLTSIHHSLIVYFFGLLIWIGFLQFQILEDGSIASLSIVSFWTFICLFAFDYIFLDSGFGISNYFMSKPASHLYSPWTFTLVFLFPIISVFLYSIFTTIVSLKTLKEFKPIYILILSITNLIIGSVIFRYLITKKICESSESKVDGSFIGTIFESLSILTFYNLWINLTEDDWDDDDDDNDEVQEGQGQGQVNGNRNDGILGSTSNLNQIGNNNFLNNFDDRNNNNLDGFK